MTAAIATTIMEIQKGKRAIHPFFEKPKSQPAAVPSTVAFSPVNVNAEPDTSSHGLREANNDSANERPAPTSFPPQFGPPVEPNAAGLLEDQADHTAVDLNQSRRKRQRVTPPRHSLESTLARERATVPTGLSESNAFVASDARQPPRAAASASTQSRDPRSVNQRPRLIVKLPLEKSGKAAAVERANPEVPQHGRGQAENPETATPQQKPQRILKLNSKTGTIGSPPKKPANASNGMTAPAAPTRKRKGAKSLTVCLKYGQATGNGLRVGNHINEILENKKPAETVQKPETNGQEVKLENKKPETNGQEVELENKKPAETTQKQEANGQVKPEKVKPEKPKSTHPFFLGKLKPKPQTKECDTPLPSVAAKSDTATVPNSIIPPARHRARSPARSDLQSASSNSFPAFGFPAKQMKFPGAVEPIWPPEGMTHVRGPMDCLPPMPAKSLPASISFDDRKSKGTASEITPQEDILHAITKRLPIDEIRKELKEANSDQFEAPDASLRLPKRHFKSALKLQRCIRSQIKSAVDLESSAHDPNADEISNINPRSEPCPAVNKLYESIPHTLSAFDKSECPTQSWVHKYSPRSAEEIIQSGREAFILRDWLKTLKVLSVDTGAGESDSSKLSAAKFEKTAKRKRKPNKLDGFVVSSDEEAGEMDELSGTEDDLPHGSQSNQRKTLIRHGTTAKGLKESGRLANTVVISGPNGCGKTAAVYAVAKELDFEIFEINSSTRRSGKDILEKVGDMTKNHLVQHRQRGTEDVSDLERASDAVAADLTTGRQGTMKSFFKSATPKDEKAKPAKKPVEQRQSLILLEEVDILFEEDKQFWATVLGLIVQSKRPIILTCNDESFVLNQALPLHAVIRFSPPPFDAAVDYMLLVAASEGHILQRQAVSALYQCKRYDLRASMTELEFWCQFGVGDRRGGFDWFLPRLPQGIDRDASGDTIRVLSQDTYRTGMGWLGRDVLCDPYKADGVEDEILREAWDEWQLDAGDWHETLGLGTWATKMPAIPEGERLSVLETYDDFTDAMSAADICACGEFGVGKAALVEKTAPPVSAKAMEDVVTGYEFVQADVYERQNAVGRSISSSLKSLARAQANAQTHNFSDPGRSKLDPISEAQVITQIINSRTKPPQHITRPDYSAAFDPIASAEKPGAQPTSSLEPSCLDRSMALIAVDIAPYIRTIVAHDVQWQQARAQLSNLLSEGGRPGKRVRTTRAARSALEGGPRKTARRERWFGDEVSARLVERTGGACWREALEEVMGERGACGEPSSSESE